MGSYAIRMPDLGEGIAEVELVAWRVKPGDTVQEDQVLADVMTDKATVEIPSPVRGTVVSLEGEPGKPMAVGTEFIRLEVEGAGNVQQQGSLSRERERAGVRVEADQPSPWTPGRAENPHPGPFPQAGEGERPEAAPAVRHRAAQLGIELNVVQGSGPGGRVLHEDLDTLLVSRKQSSPNTRREGEESIPITGLRRRIAQKMQESKRRIPHFSYVEEVDVTDLERARAQLNERYAGARSKLSVLPFIARAMVLALDEFPQMNARFDDEAGVVMRSAPVHLGMAVQTDVGLMVPVVRHAEALDLWALAQEVERLAQACRAGRATRDQLAGSTITLTSLGPLGGIASTPVINHPEVAIVGVNRIVERPVLRGGAVVGRSLMNLSSSFDHRVVDGMDAARFIQAIRALLEAPALLLAA